MKVFLVNPANHSFGVAAITPRWLFVLAGATPAEFGEPVVVDEALDQIRIEDVGAGDVIGIGIHTSNALRGYEVGRLAAARGAFVVFGGIHATLYPDESFTHGAANTVVTGDGERAWGQVLRDHANGVTQRTYEGGRLSGDALTAARWDLIRPGQYLVGCVQTVRGCPKHCSFCSVWRTDGQKPRQRAHEVVVDEIRELHQLGFRFVLLADDNFYPVTYSDLAKAEKKGDLAQLASLRELREERFELLESMATLPRDMIFFTQITMEAAEDVEFLQAMSRARIKFVLVGVETVSPEGLKAIRKDFNDAGDALVERLKVFSQNGVNVLASFIFGLPTDKPDVFEATLDVAERADVALAQFVRLTPFPGTVDFMHWEKKMRAELQEPQLSRLTRYWLVPYHERPKVQVAHPVMSPAELLTYTIRTWRQFYRVGSIWRRSHFMASIKARLWFVLGSKLFAQMYFYTGVASDSARASRAAKWSGVLTRVSHRLITRRIAASS